MLAHAAPAANPRARKIGAKVLRSEGPAVAVRARGGARLWSIRDTDETLLREVLVECEGVTDPLGTHEPETHSIN